MKRNIYISGILLLAAVSCTREPMIEDSNVIPEGERMVFSADLNPSVKSSFANDGKTLVWDEEDRVCVGSVKVLSETSFEDPFVFDCMPVDIDGNNPSKASFLSYKKRSYWVGGENGTEGSLYAFFALYPASVAGNPQVVLDSDENIWIPVEISRHQDGKHFGRYQVCWDFAADAEEYMNYAYTREQILGGQTVTFNNFRPLSTVLNFNMIFDPNEANLTSDIAIKTIRIYSHWDATYGFSQIAGAGAVSPAGVLMPASEVNGLTNASSNDMVIDLTEPVVVGSSVSEYVLASIFPSVRAASSTLDFEAYDEDGNLRLEGSATSPSTGFVSGKKYTFTVNMKEAETTVLALECPREYPSEGGAYTGRLLSYTYENGERVAVPYVIKFYENELCTDEVEDVSDPSYWLHFNEFVDSGEIGVETAIYGVNANQNITMIADPVDATTAICQTLRTADYRGSQQAPWNLATPDGSMDFTKASTANCYIVNNPGYYVIPCVVGNGVKNGTFNTTAYIPIAEDNGESPIFQDYLGTAISNPIIGQNPGNGTPTKAYLLWEDCNGLISTAENYELQLVEQDGVYGIVFEIPSESIDQGNAVIAVVDEQNRVMWSWHIWVTDYDPYTNYLPVISYWSDGEYDMMKRNLGWVLTGISNEIKYDSNHMYVKITQTIEGGKEIVVHLQQLGMSLYEADIQHGYCPYYQAGRKDPFTPGYRDEDDGYMHDVTIYGKVKDMTGLNFLSENRYENPTASHTLKDAIQNPWIYFYRYSGQMDGYGWFDDKITTNTSLWNNILSSEISGGGTISQILIDKAVSRKTIYDPNPVGFVMPSMDAGGTFFAFFTGGKYENYLSELAGDDTLKEKYVSLLISASPYGSSYYASVADKQLAESGHADQAKTGFFPQVGRRYHMLDGQFQTSEIVPVGHEGDSEYDFANAPNCGGYYSNIVDKGMSAVLLCSYPNMNFGFLTMSTSALPIRSMKEPPAQQQP